MKLEHDTVLYPQDSVTIRENGHVMLVDPEAPDSSGDR